MLSRRKFLSLTSAVAAHLFFAPWLNASKNAQKRNLLFLAIDDLRPVMGCYGGKAITPNIDKFSASATTFSHHYVQWPVCGPSRAALMSGLRPDTSGVYQNSQANITSKHQDKWPAMSRYFYDNGYKTFSFGKIYHGKGVAKSYGWSEKPWNPPSAWTCYVNFKRKKKSSWRPAYEIYDGPDNLHGDYQTADKAIEKLEQNKNNLFCIFAGFYKPHLPFVAPKKYWDMYDHDKIERLKPMEMPAGVIDHAYKYSELHSYGDQKGSMFSKENRPDDEDAINLTHAYYASVSFIDAQIGRIFKHLDELGLSENTAVVIWGDHGFHLGDQARWAKHTQLENDMRSPLMIRLPGIEHKKQTLNNLVETVDIYPTVCEYLGLAAPKHLDGTSLVPVMTGKDKTGKEAAFSQYSPVPKEHSYLMIYSARTRHYRYIQWRDTNDNNKLIDEELYDLRDFPAETKNVVKEPEYKSALKNCRDIMNKHLKIEG